VPVAISKGVEEAKRSFFRVPRIQGTIPHAVQGEAAAGVVSSAPRPRYRGYRRRSRAGRARVRGDPRRPLEVARSSNAINIVHGDVAALKQLEQPEAVAARRGKPVDEVAPSAMLRAQAKGAK